MAYRLNKYGDQVLDDLNAVEQKTIYPEATTANDGLMTQEHVEQLNHVTEDVETLTDYEIMMICR